MLRTESGLGGKVHPRAANHAAIGLLSTTRSAAVHASALACRRVVLTAAVQRLELREEATILLFRKILRAFEDVHI